MAHLINRMWRSRGHRVHELPLDAREGEEGKPWALVSYLGWAYTATDERLAQSGHSNAWASREWTRVLHSLGYNVVGIDWRDSRYRPDREFAVIVDIEYNLARLERDLPSSALKVLFCTHSDAFYQNQAELRRVEAVNARRQVACQPRRLIADPELSRRSLERCDVAVLDGNEHTRSTYPEHLRDKMRLVGEPGADIGANRKTPARFVPRPRDFLWFFGYGAIHKGLDLVLEVFAVHPELHLHVVGLALKESDFIAAYERELTRLPNVHVYGVLHPASREFRAVVSRCVAFLGTSCSESTSSSVVTCLKVGLYPIVTRDCGVSLPLGVGRYLEGGSAQEIEDAVQAVHRAPASHLAEGILAAQDYAYRNHTRERFSGQLKVVISKALG